MNEQNNQNVYNNAAIPQTPVEPINDFEPVRPMYSQPVQPNEPVQYNQPTEVQQPVYQQPINQMAPASQVEQPLGPNPIPAVEPSYEQPTNTFEQAPIEPAQAEPQMVQQPTEEPKPQVEPLPVEPQVTPVMGGNVEETVEAIMDEPTKKEKSRHNKNNGEDWNEKPKKKGHGVIIVLLILIILGLAAYIVYDKGVLDPIISKITGTEPKTEEKKEEVTETPEVEVDEVQNNQTSSLYEQILLGQAYAKYEEAIDIYFDLTHEVDENGEPVYYTINNKQYRKPSIQKYDNIFTANGKKQLIDSGIFVEQDGVMYRINGDRGSHISYVGTVLTITKIEGNTQEYLATSYYCDNKLNENMTKNDCTTKEAKFILVGKQIEFFTLPN